MPQEFVLPKSEADCLSEEIDSLLRKEVISVPMNETSEQGFVSQLFAVPKKKGRRHQTSCEYESSQFARSYVHQVSFKMEGLHPVRDLLRPDDWMTNRADWKDA